MAGNAVHRASIVLPFCEAETATALAELLGQYADLERTPERSRRRAHSFGPLRVCVAQPNRRLAHAPTHLECAEDGDDVLVLQAGMDADLPEHLQQKQSAAKVNDEHWGARRTTEGGQGCVFCFACPAPRIGLFQLALAC